jgi:hypothetical protein
MQPADEVVAEHRSSRTWVKTSVGSDIQAEQRSKRQGRTMMLSVAVTNGLTSGIILINTTSFPSPLLECIAIADPGGTDKPNQGGQSGH